MLNFLLYLRGVNLNPFIVLMRSIPSAVDDYKDNERGPAGSGSTPQCGPIAHNVARTLLSHKCRLLDGAT